MAQQDVIDVPKLILSFVLGVFITITMIMGAQALYLWGQESETSRKDHSNPYAHLTKVTADARADLASSAVVSENGGTPDKVQIPIERAMHYVIEEHKGN